MCGISGIVAKGNRSVNRADLQAMNDCVQHRGPDAEGFYLHGKVGLAHRRLSILDLSALGSQPMHYAERYTITFNGEVYNYIEIRETLKSKGYTFLSESDTEVILAAYHAWGEGCVHEFNGMWAFAIYDRQQNNVFLSRDRFGVKPLYYFDDDTNLAFGSEIRQLLPKLPMRKVNRQILFDYLFLGYHHHTAQTFFEGIHALDPGHNMIIDLEHDTRITKRWYALTLREDIARLSESEAQQLFKQTLDNAIQLRLRSDVKVGTCLSGGLDSSYIAAVAADRYHQHASKKFTAITAQSFEKENDETGYARMVADQSNLNWKVTQPQKADFFRVMEDVIETQEEPFGSPSVVMQYFVMAKAKEEGCIVLLDGQGGDEALLGYDRYYAAYVNQQHGLFAKIRSFFKISRNSKLNPLSLFLYTLYFNYAPVRAARQLRRSRFVKAPFRKYFNNALVKKISDAGKNLTTLQKLEISHVQLQKLLKYEDRNSMRFSIETRVPFVDYRVMELSLSLPFFYKIKDGWSKFILRKAAEGVLPDEIVWRKTKIGFEAPKKWFGDKQKLVDTIKSSPFLAHFIDGDKLADSTDDNTLWRLYNLAVWARIFKVEF